MQHLMEWNFSLNIIFQDKICVLRWSPNPHILVRHSIKNSNQICIDVLEHFGCIYDDLYFSSNHVI